MLLLVHGLRKLILFSSAWLLGAGSILEEFCLFSRFELFTSEPRLWL